MIFFRILMLKLAVNWSLFMGDYNRAIPRLEALLRTQKMLYGKNQFKTLPTMLLLAESFHRCGKKPHFAGAIWLYQEAMAIAEYSNDPAKDLMIGRIANSMGSWYAECNNNALADETYQKSIEAFSRSVGLYSKDLLKPLYGRASALRALNKKVEAQPLEQWAKQIEDAQKYMDQFEYHGHYPRF